MDPDEFDAHRDGDRHQDGEFLPGLADLFAGDDPWDEDAPTFEKWRKGGQWS